MTRCSESKEITSSNIESRVRVNEYERHDQLDDFYMNLNGLVSDIRALG